MDIKIRQEKPADYEAVFKLIKKAFKKVEMSDHKEQFLVQLLRNSTSFVPELSLIAEYENEIIGHILLTKITIKNDQTEFNSLALAPVTVLPKYQKKGIGGMLIEQAHKKAIELGFKSVILLGHADYYPRFGYKKASRFGVQLPFDVPDEYCMAIELTTGGLHEVNGIVEYPKEFNG
ncbi:N-acetyltransferase [Rhodohalobacter sp. SW132]|uniref:GNAT family N-acetyltransferase n=1 Tax=Rhodohalobacter sp. SW132 TaxID=2293433 RepID=UPI000E2257E6|nr:N-acetyltransferase [Rhodohalobacter sp. SW132]REL32924.1 N-acetyltransferase [Rhodohalobacter sp. SW132]